MAIRGLLENDIFTEAVLEVLGNTGVGTIMEGVILSEG